MKRNRILNIVLIVGLLFMLAGLGGCVPEGTEGLSSMVPLIIMLVLIVGMFYFLMIRPMRQRQKQHDQMVEELQRGDKVVTAGGMYGQVESINDDSVVLKVESGATIRVTKGGVLNREAK